MSVVLRCQSTSIIGASIGDAIATWPDSSGNGFDATAAGSAQPTYQIDGNGVPYLSFDGAANVMNAGTLGSWGATPGRTQMQAGATLFVAFATARTAIEHLLGNGDSALDCELRISLNQNAFSSNTVNAIFPTWVQSSARGFSREWDGASPADGGFHVLAVRFDAMVSGVTTTGAVWLDAIASGALTSTLGQFSGFQHWQISSAGLGIGAHLLNGTPVGFFLGSLYHVEIQGTPLTDAQIVAQINALTAAYASSTSTTLGNRTFVNGEMIRGQGTRTWVNGRRVR